MVTVTKGLVALSLGLAVTVFASPSFAQGRQNYSNLQGISPARWAAIRTCSVAAARYPDYLWGDFEMYTYRACMAGRGQIE